MGSGPSLKSVDIGRLAEYDTIAFNRSYVAWDRWGFHPTYYACFDAMSLRDNAQEIMELIRESSVSRFFLHEAAAEWDIGPSDRVQLVRLAGDSFSTELGGLADFGNVGASSLQVLAGLRYRRVALVGVDARYSTAPGAGPQDYFTPEYAAGKVGRADPDWHFILEQWPTVAEACGQAGMEVRNASPESALSCFEPITFEDALSWVSLSLAAPRKRGRW